MIAVDTNILVYAHRMDSMFQDAAHTCLTRLINSQSPWAIPWPCVHEFFGVATHPRVFKPPTPQAQAFDQIEAWLQSPSLVLLTESPAHWSQLKTLLQRGKTIGPGVHDARVAALCLQHGVSALWSSDRDFGRYPSLKVVNPLVA